MNESTLGPCRQAQSEKTWRGEDEQAEISLHHAANMKEGRATGVRGFRTPLLFWSPWLWLTQNWRVATVYNSVKARVTSWVICQPALLMKFKLKALANTAAFAESVWSSLDQPKMFRQPVCLRKTLSRNVGVKIQDENVIRGSTRPSGYIWLFFLDKIVLHSILKNKMFFCWCKQGHIDKAEWELTIS